MKKTWFVLPVAVAVLALLVPSPGQGGIRDDETLVEIGEHIEDLAESLKRRLKRIESAAKGEDLDDLLEDQATDLTEYEALDLDRYLRHGGETTRECWKARQERERELRHRYEELRAARRALAEAENDRERENARARLRRQREHLRREIDKTREILERVCGEEGPDRPDRFIPPGHAKHRGVGHHFAPGKGHEKFEQDRGDGHRHHEDTDLPPGQQGKDKKGKGGKKAKD